MRADKTASISTICAVAGLFAFTISAPAAAAEPKAVATFGDWSVFVRDVDGDKVCFAATEARDKSPKSVNHGNIFFLIASWASGAADNQPSLMTGYNLKDAPKPTLRVGSEKWQMYTDDNEAFIESGTDEKSLISAMRRGADMQVSAVSSRGTATNYRISLRGVTAALERVEKSCR
ncbi:MAG: invasion associated locus B family protein [Pseudomonadota bacterium]